MEWNGYGYEKRKAGIYPYDAGVDANDMNPVSTDEIINFFAVS